MDFNKTLQYLQEALNSQQQKATDTKALAIANAKKKNAALANVPDEDFEYDEKTNTLKRLKLTPSEIAKLKNVRVQ